MEKFVWDSEKYGVDHELVDFHHQTLMNIINSLIELASEEEPKRSEYLQVLMKVNDYAHYHFKAEEGLMATFEYPELERHRGEHIAFMERASTLVLTPEEKRCYSPQACSKQQAGPT